MQVIVINLFQTSKVPQTRKLNPLTWYHSNNTVINANQITIHVTQIDKFYWIQILIRFAKKKKTPLSSTYSLKINNNKVNHIQLINTLNSLFHWKIFSYPADLFVFKPQSAKSDQSKKLDSFGQPSSDKKSAQKRLAGPVEYGPNSQTCKYI